MSLGIYEFIIERIANNHRRTTNNEKRYQKGKFVVHPFK